MLIDVAVASPFTQQAGGIPGKQHYWQTQQKGQIRKRRRSTSDMGKQGPRENTITMMREVTPQNDPG